MGPRPLALLAGGALLAALLTGCGDRDGREDLDVRAPGSTVPEPSRTLEGTITSVTPMVPVTEDCTPPEELDPDASVSDEDPPVCTDLDTAPLGWILVEAVPGEQAGEKISFAVRQDTRIEDEAGTARTFGDLQEGGRALVTYSGAIAESYPGQGTADVVRLLAAG